MSALPFATLVPAASAPDKVNLTPLEGGGLGPSQSHGLRPTKAALREASYIRLTRAPVSAAAIAFVSAVAARCTENLQPGAQRTGPARLQTLTVTLGRVLGGLLQAPRPLRIVAAPAGHNAPFWKSAGLGRKAFWTVVGLLRVAGFLNFEPGLKRRQPFGGRPVGNAAKLWPTSALLGLAEEHGLSWDASESAWPLPGDAHTQGRPAIPYHDLVRGMAPEADAAAVEASRAFVARLNAHIGDADIRGCTPILFYRKFNGDLRLGGRLYTPGSDSLHNVPKTDRAAITINGEPVVEVDGAAMQLSLLLNLAGVATAELLAGGLLYAFPGIPRDDVKAFVTQSIGGGKPKTRWARNKKGELPGTPIRVVREAVLTRYPALADMPAILPSEPLEVPEDKDLHWAAGQFLVGLEARGMVLALEALMGMGVVALPIHDAVVVPRRYAEMAVGVLREAYGQVVRFPPQFRVKRDYVAPLETSL